MMPATYTTWCERYASYYDTELERRIEYSNYLRNHADITAVLNEKAAPAG